MSFANDRIWSSVKYSPVKGSNVKVSGFHFMISPFEQSSRTRSEWLTQVQLISFVIIDDLMQLNDAFVMESLHVLDFFLHLIETCLDAHPACFVLQV